MYGSLNATYLWNSPAQKIKDIEMRIASVDLISNTCFPALAADVLGFFEKEGLDVQISLVPALGATRALKNNSVDAMIAGSVHDVLTEFDHWEGVSICVALSQGTPWLLTMRKDFEAKRGNFGSLKDCTFTAAEGPDLAFKQVLRAGGIDADRDVKIIELPGANSENISFGVFAAEKLASGYIDGFWANAMGAEKAITSGSGKLHLDVRRGDDPEFTRYFTFAGLVVRDDFIEREGDQVEAAVRAIVRAQSVLRRDPTVASEIGEKKFPKDTAKLISNVISRDVEFYDPFISQRRVQHLNNFARLIGHIKRDVAYEKVVSSRCKHLWVKDV